MCFPGFVHSFVQASSREIGPHFILAKFMSLHTELKRLDGLKKKKVTPLIITIDYLNDTVREQGTYYHEPHLADPRAHIWFSECLLSSLLRTELSHFIGKPAQMGVVIFAALVGPGLGIWLKLGQSELSPGILKCEPSQSGTHLLLRG